MKGHSAALQVDLARECTTVTTCVKLTLTNYQPRIVNVTKANPGVVELLWAPDYLDGDNAFIVGVLGMTELNYQDVVLTKIDDTHFSIGIDTTGYTAYQRKGELRKVIGFTSFVRDLVFENVRYRATLGYMPTSIQSTSDLAVDNTEVIGLMANEAIYRVWGLQFKGLSDQDLEVGRLDHADIEIFNVNYEDLTHGRLILPASGNVGEMKIRRGTYEAEFRGKTQALQQTFLDLYSKLCRAEVGDDVTDYRRPGFGCKVRLNPEVWRAATAYTVRPLYDASKGSVVKPSVFNGRHFDCTVAGTSGATEPVWNLAIDSTTVDGTVTWTAHKALTVHGSVTWNIDRRFFEDNARTEAPATGLGINTVNAQYAIRGIDQGTKTFAIDSDLASYFTSGTTFSITGSKANDGQYTTTIASFTSGRTRITVSESIPSSNVSGSIGAPLTLPTGFFAMGRLTFLTGANKGITKEIKDFHLSNYPIVDVDDGAQTFMIANNWTALFSVDQQIIVTDSTGNDSWYNITAISYNIGTNQTEIVVDIAVASAVVDGSILGGPGVFELFERMPYEMEIGDEYEATAGCDWSKEVCKVKFDNVKNRRAEDEIPGTDVAQLIPDRPSA